MEVTEVPRSVSFKQYALVKPYLSKTTKTEKATTNEFIKEF